MAVATSTALTIAAVAAVAGSGVAAYGAIEQGKTAKAVGRFNAKTAENAAITKDMEMRESINRTRRRNKKLLSAQRAKIAGAGVIEAGSPLELMGETAGQLELSILDQHRAGLSEISRFKQQASLDLFQGSAASRASKIGAGATLLSGGAQAGSILYQK